MRRCPWQGGDTEGEVAMEVTIEKIEVDQGQEPTTYWVTARGMPTPLDKPRYWDDEFACDPSIWDVMRGVGELACYSEVE